MIASVSEASSRPSKRGEEAALTEQQQKVTSLFERLPSIMRTEKRTPLLQGKAMLYNEKRCLSNMSTAFLDVELGGKTLRFGCVRAAYLAARFLAPNLSLDHPYNQKIAAMFTSSRASAQALARLFVKELAISREGDLRSIRKADQPEETYGVFAEGLNTVLEKRWQFPVRHDWPQVRLKVMMGLLALKFLNAERLDCLKKTQGALDEDNVDPFWGKGATGQGQRWLGKCLSLIRERGCAVPPSFCLLSPPPLKEGEDPLRELEVFLAPRPSALTNLSSLPKQEQDVLQQGQDLSQQKSATPTRQWIRCACVIAAIVCVWLVACYGMEKVEKGES